MEHACCTDVLVLDLRFWSVWRHFGDRKTEAFAADFSCLHKVYNAPERTRPDANEKPEKPVDVYSFGM